MTKFGDWARGPTLASVHSGSQAQQRIRDLANLAAQLEEELSPRQRENGDLVFQVCVSNYGPRPYSAREVARRLVSDWEQRVWDEGQPLVRVRLEESTALAACKEFMEKYHD